jgi:hypothetical protein
VALQLLDVSITATHQLLLLLLLLLLLALCCRQLPAWQQLG